MRSCLPAPVLLLVDNRLTNLLVRLNMADDINRSNWSDHTIEANNSSRRQTTNSHQQHHQASYLNYKTVDMYHLFVLITHLMFMRRKVAFVIFDVYSYLTTIVKTVFLSRYT
ncbi:hypothetical protein Bhyg_12447 [Pseudolycoriella hygida]|uniref:Uncharacterized protein n=1 Tax=Pseudolycoriella hygida TaxID=35572 RepID=A0A9Q0MXL2_9DIPT|nr:hypothetical protein Bhyg_12447 [Pseudolycoriella hygida]